MFCSKCGKEIQNEAKFCPECGVQVATVDTGIPEKQEVANNLKPYKQLKDCLCLECGYSGPMGVVRKVPRDKETKKNFLALKIFAGSTVLLLLSFGLVPIALIAGVVWFVFIARLEGKAERYVLFCPSCKREIEER